MGKIVFSSIVSQSYLAICTGLLTATQYKAIQIYYTPLGENVTYTLGTTLRAYLKIVQLQWFNYVDRYTIPQKTGRKLFSILIDVNINSK